MKLLVAIIHQRDVWRLRDALRVEDFRFTELGSVGGFLREGSVTLLLGVEDEQVERVLELVRANCEAREQITSVAPPHSGTHAQAGGELIVTVGGAQVFVMQLERVVAV